MWANKILLSGVSKMVPLQLGAIYKFLAAAGLLADILPLAVHVGVLPQCGHVDEGLAAAVVAAEEEDLRGRLDLARRRLWLPRAAPRAAVLLQVPVDVLCDGEKPNC